MMARPAKFNRERSFGVSVGGVLMVIALALLWRGRIARAEVVGGVGLTLVMFGWLRPTWLKRPSDAWWAVATVLGWFNARVLLSIAFFLVLTPIGFLMRARGRDPMARRRRAYRGWIPYAHRYRDTKHFDRMF
jgi:hypothetical protein